MNRNLANVCKDTKEQDGIGGRLTHVAGTRKMMTLRVKRKELSWVAPNRKDAVDRMRQWSDPLIHMMLNAVIDALKINPCLPILVPHKEMEAKDLQNLIRSAKPQ
jgi:hypothetical protein